MDRSNLEKAKKLNDMIKAYENRKANLEKMEDGRVSALLQHETAPNCEALIPETLMDLSFLRDMAIRTYEKEISRLEAEMKEL